MLARLCFLIALFSVAAHAADTPAPTQPAPTQPPNTLQQRIMACTACHGEQGQGKLNSKFFPRLAGKPAEYLARQMVDFQDGMRKYAPMQYIVGSLSPAYIHEIAEYFASQKVPYASSPAPQMSAAALARGEALTVQGDEGLKIPACESCHGKNLTGVQPSIPGIIGLPYDYVSAQLGSWRTGVRAGTAPDCMATIAKRLTPDDISAVSAWLATRQLPSDMSAQPAGSVKPPIECGVLTAPPVGSEPDIAQASRSTGKTGPNQAGPNQASTDQVSTDQASTARARATKARSSGKTVSSQGAGA
jgi:cytochrome c553